MRRRQELPSEAFFSPEEACALLDRGDRSILALSHCWQTAKHCDSRGETLKRVRSYLCSEPSAEGCALFVDMMSLYQKDEQGNRTDEEQASFARSINVMGYCYASITGTTTLQVKHVPGRPPEYDGQVALFGLEPGFDAEKLRFELEQYGELLWCGEVVRGQGLVQFATHHEAEMALLRLRDRGFAVDVVWNERPYDGMDGARGWTQFEQARPRVHVRWRCGRG